jgi:hypothetical protein
MITQRYFERDGDRILWRIALDDSAVLDVLTSDVELAQCRELLHMKSHDGLPSVRMGKFGPFDVTMTLRGDGSVTLFIDGPDLGPAFAGNQSVGAYIGWEEMLAALDETKNFPLPSMCDTESRSNSS